MKHNETMRTDSCVVAMVTRRRGLSNSLNTCYSELLQYIHPVNRDCRVQKENKSDFSRFTFLRFCHFSANNCSRILFILQQKQVSA